MKAKRRQELKTNDLAQALEDLSSWFRGRGVYVVGAAAAVVIVVVIVSYMNSAKAEAINQAYAELHNASNIAPSGVRKSDAEIQRAFEKIGDLTARTNDAGFRLDALLRRGDMALRLAEMGTEGFEAKYLPDARSAYEEIVSNYKDYTLHYGRALYGLFQLEADEFAADSDLRHRGQAVRHLQVLRDDARFNGTPFQTMAVDALNELDSIFTVVTFAKAPAPTPSPVASPAGAAPAGNPVPPSMIEAPAPPDAGGVQSLPETAAVQDEQPAGADEAEGESAADGE